MDVIRNSLIVGLAVVSYLLLLAWNEDYPQQANRDAQETAAPAQQTAPAGNDLPAGGAAADSGQAQDLPEVQEQAAAEQAPEPQEPAGRERISVSTPVHQVEIDPVGGDIVRLSLPQYPTSLETPDDPFVLLRNDVGGIHVARSGLIGADGPDASQSGRPVYTSDRDSYMLEAGQLTVDLHHTTAAGVQITKRFIFDAEDYLIRIRFLVDNPTADSWIANLFGQVKRDGRDDPSSIGGLGMRDYLGGVLTTPDDPYKTVDFDDMEDGTTDVVQGGWIGFSQHYFLSAWIPDNDTENTFRTRTNAAGEYLMEFVTPAMMIDSGDSGAFEAEFWAGPKDQNRLEQIRPNLDLTIDYGFLWFIASPLFWLLTQINDFFGNWGWSIIGMTIVIKVLFSKLSATSYRSMAKMRRLAPKVNELRERYGDDKQKLMQEQMNLWKKEKVNPLGGCLPLLLQMPVLIGIYWVLNKSVELRHADWILWYEDLSAMDPYFVLPLIMGASMFVSQLMTPITTADPMQAKVIRFMPVIFTVFFLWFPAGLVLYWLVSNLFNIAQQSYINHKVEREYQARKG